MKRVGRDHHFLLGQLTSHFCSYAPDCFLFSILNSILVGCSMGMPFCVSHPQRGLWVRSPWESSNLFAHYGHYDHLVQRVKCGHLASALPETYHPHRFQGAQVHNSISYCNFQLTEDSFPSRLAHSYRCIHYCLFKKRPADLAEEHD